MESPTEDQFKPLCKKTEVLALSTFQNSGMRSEQPDWVSIYREFPANTRKILHDIEVKPLNEAPASAWLYFWHLLKNPLALAHERFGRTISSDTIHIHLAGADHP